MSKIELIYKDGNEVELEDPLYYKDHGDFLEIGQYSDVTTFVNKDTLKAFTVMSNVDLKRCVMK